MELEEKAKRWFLLYRDKGLTLEEIGEKDGVSKQYVQSVLSRVPQYVDLINEKWISKKELVKLREQGKTIEQIATKFKCSIGHIHNLLEKYELDQTYNLSKTHWATKGLQSRLNRIRGYLMKRVKPNVIAVKLKLNPNTVRRLIRDYEVYMASEDDWKRMFGSLESTNGFGENYADYIAKEKAKAERKNESKQDSNSQLASKEQHQTAE